MNSDVPEVVVLERAVDLLSTMAHPTRLGALVHLHRRGPASVGELEAALCVEQSVLSHHLGHLRAARLVVGERVGRRIVYRLHDAHIGGIVEQTLQHARESVNDGSAGCGAG